MTLAVAEMWAKIRPIFVGRWNWNDSNLHLAMEEITEAVNNINLAAPGDSYKKNRIQVSNTKKPLFFYVNLAKRYMQQHNEVELSALGMAIATVVTVAEILKNNGLAVEKKIMTSTVDMKDDSRGRPIQKAKGTYHIPRLVSSSLLLHKSFLY
uniref:DNA/RNA-binding protein Alba-like domain-containing protein n=1 Tax=Cannabis sativa TaxID=3483 RepID=A0A803QBU2_CANSA